ncbi:MAG TPA: hypothetical protein VG733_00135 [Chthoniobacteraceae bacterium]|nr:hypothetical protein [Chthoniobacteraceae bacterium]
MPHFSFLKRIGRRHRRRAAPGLTPEEAKRIAHRDALDVGFYRKYYSDLAHMTEEEALRHYALHGRGEERYPNLGKCIEFHENEIRKLPEDFNPEEYLAANPELAPTIDIARRYWEPAMHYLKYGRWEGRPYKHGTARFTYDAAILHRMTDYVYDMPDVVPDPGRRPTVNVLVPPFHFSTMSAGFFGVFHVALFIKQCGLRVRLVMYAPFVFDKALFREKIQHYPGMEKLFDDLEVDYIGDRDHPLRISPRDNCVATVCHSAYFAKKIMEARGGGKFLYVIQDHESSFYANGALSAIADKPYAFNYAALFSSESLRNHFLTRGVGSFGQGHVDHLHMNNACCANLKPWEEFLAAHGGDKPRKFFFYARPQVSRNMFEIGALALCMAYREGVFAGGEWEFIGAGIGEPEIELGPGVSLKQMKRMNLREYREVVSTFDLGLCLMASPHPSITPFDLHGSGATVVTNSHGVKDQAYFDSVAPGIIVAEPDVPSVVAALRKAVAASADLAARHRNAGMMNYPRDWKDTFGDEHVHFVRRIFSETLT